MKSKIKLVGNRLNYWSPEPKFNKYNSRSMYEEQGILPIEPMTAKEETKEEVLDKMLRPNSGYYVEEKFDGTRATMHFYNDHCRVFSRRISKKTNWYSENTDSVPHLRDMNIPELCGTIIDGEMFIPNRPFKDVSSTLNCLYDEAIRRQKELGFITLNAFDIIYYKGENVTHLPLSNRKELLDEVCKTIASKYPTYVRPVKYSDTSMEVTLPEYLLDQYAEGKITTEVYPELTRFLDKNYSHYEMLDVRTATLNKRAYYDFIVATGGEGIILKDKNGKYYHKRGREYTKMKKFLTKDVIVIGFEPPTKEYTGKSSEWEYWVDSQDTRIHSLLPMSQGEKKNLTPVTKHYYMNWIGTIKFGVVIEESERLQLSNSKKGKDFEFWRTITEDGNLDLVLVGECSGFDEELREEISNNTRAWKGKVIEVLANEIFKDTGKLRHPRFLRDRLDKNPSQCTWVEHVN